MEETKQRLKVYCETSFWSYLNGGRTPLSHIAVKQAFTRQWWETIAPTCDVYVSQHVGGEAEDGDPIMEEIYAIRRKISERYGHNIHRYIEAMRAKQREEEAAGIVHHFVRLPIARTVPAPTMA